MKLKNVEKIILVTFLKPREYNEAGWIITDLELFARLIQCEAGGEGEDGMKAVASVIMNRVESTQGEYGRYNTISDVILAKSQFVCAMETVGGFYNSQNIYNMSPEQIHYDIANWAIAGNRINLLGESLWFYSPRLYSECIDNFPNQNGRFIIRIGNHCFYDPTSSYPST